MTTDMLPRRRVRHISKAHWAQCETCETVIQCNCYWPLAQSIWLHKHGSCPKPRITLWAFA